MLRLSVFLAVCLALAGSLGAPAQAAPDPQTPPGPQTAPDPQATTTLRVQSRVVEISAVVLSKAGEPTGGLTRDDFTLRQDGHDESIRYFSQGSDLPLTLALLVDTSGSQRTFISDESLASDVFFEAMLTRPEDRAALIQVDTRVLQLQSLTASPDTLHLALERLQTTPQTSNGTLLFDAVQAVSNQLLGSARGRKAIIVLSDGGDNGSRTSMADAIATAERNNVSIYSIEYSATTMLPSPMQSGNGGLLGSVGTLAPPVAQANPGRRILQQLSESTGGRVFTVSPGTSLRAIYAHIADDLRLQYEVGYTPPPDLPPNSFHRIELRVRDRKLNVRARRGFFAQP